ncbi:MAG: SRPBCC family protein [Polyangiaceae bacterium]
MPFDVEASTTVAAPPHKVFRALADYASWERWMPPSFTPAEGTSGALTVGRVLKMKIAWMPFGMPVEVYVVDPDKEITWGGGNPKLIAARHRFFFEPSGSDTVVRSVETWTGGSERIERLLEPLVSRVAARIGRDQLAALKREVER